MKNIKIISMILLSLLFVKCQEFLEENPRSSFSMEQLLSTREGVNAAFNGIYESFNGWPSLFQWNGWQLRESLTEYSVTDPASVDPSNISKNDVDKENWALRVNFAWPYRIIANANTILQALDNITIEGEGAVEGEAKFLRAYSYYLLVQFFGDVPLLTGPFDANAAPPRRTDEELVYELIVSDLKTAEEQLPDASQAGRANKWVAKSLLAKVYLTMAGNPLNQTQLYADALAKAKEVINSGKYQLATNYAHNFTVNNSVESIWEVQNRAIGNDNHMNFVFIPRGTPGISGEAVALPTQTFINSFPEGDIRRSWGIRDSILVNNVFVKLPVSFYYKYIDEQAANQGTSFSSTQGIPIIRYAEILLLAAEAENEVNGPTVDSYSWINMVRSRARMNPNNPAHVPNLQGLTKESFREAVFNERRWELFVEGDGWFDLKRLNRFNLIPIRRPQVQLVNPNISDWTLPDWETNNNPNIN